MLAQRMMERVAVHSGRVQGADCVILKATGPAEVLGKIANIMGVAEAHPQTRTLR